MASRVGIYLRISDDRDGQQTATERQRKDCAKYAKAHGWAVADVFEDVDTSAFKRTVRRPEFERMLEAVRAKQIDGVLSWKIDRITRRQRDLVRLDEACEEAGGFIASVVETIDTRTSTGRFVAELLVAQARMESENMRVRVTRKHEERAIEGKPSLGGRRLFGYSPDRRKIVAAEARLIREAARRICAGESLRGIVREWHDHGSTTTTGRPWTSHSLRRLLMSAALSGQRDHNGKLTPGQWPAVLSPDDTRRVRAVLGDATRLTGRGARTYLLSGMIRCGRCGERLVAHPRSADHTRRYACIRATGKPNCGGIVRKAEPIEAFVAEAVAIALDGADLRRFIEKPTDDTADVITSIRADEEAMQELSKDYYTEKAISRAEFFAARDVLNARLEGNRKVLAKTNGHTTIGKFIGAGGEVRKQWAGQTLDWRRAIIGAMIAHVVVMPAGVTGRAAFDPSKIKIAWRF